MQANSPVPTIKHKPKAVVTATFYPQTQLPLIKALMGVWEELNGGSNIIGIK